MKIFYILLIIICGFIMNIILYYVSATYRGFMQNLKSDEVNIEVTDDYSISKDEIKDYQNQQLWEKAPWEFWIGSANGGLNEWGLSTVVVNDLSSTPESMDLTPYQKEIYSRFSGFWLNQLLTHSSLMDVTNEYAYKYFEYYSTDLSFYIFPGRTYKEVKEVFDLDNTQWLYYLNELDNFWDESFYINFDWIDDWFVRLIFVSNGSVFWLKIWKNQYNAVKEILEKI